MLLYGTTEMHDPSTQARYLSRMGPMSLLPPGFKWDLGISMKRVMIIVLAILLTGTLGLNMTDDVDAQDEVPPAVMGIRVLNVAEHRFEVRWETSEPTKGGVEWGRTNKYGNTAQGPTSFETVHYLNVTGLEKGTLYHFRIFAEDLSGNVGHSKDAEVGTFPYEAADEGVSTLTWAIIAILILVLLIYFLFLRPVAG
jgi:hypothetical protein